METTSQKGNSNSEDIFVPQHKDKSYQKCKGE